VVDSGLLESGFDRGSTGMWLDPPDIYRRAGRNPVDLAGEGRSDPLRGTFLMSSTVVTAGSCW
jgi:hypothetical protein